MVINRKKRFIYYIVEKLSHLLKYRLISDEKFISKIKKAYEIMNKQRDDKQSVNKDTSLNISIKYFN